MNDFEQVFSRQNHTPLWAQELLTEIKAIRQILQAQQGPKNPYDFYDFVRVFRKVMQADTINNHYPEVEVKGSLLGVTRNGLLYDKSTSKELTRTEAFTAYKILYEQHMTKSLF